ncbi:MAG: response regulator [Acidobacteriota bacterium]|nr:response regulator [Acidobacteriota bacterium]
MRILIIDDEIEICQRLKRELEKEDYEVDYSIRVSGVLQKLRDAQKENRAYDLILLDICMPEINGLILLRKIREEKIEIEVIIITGYGDEEKTIKSMRLGAADFLTKPISLKELSMVVFRIQQRRAKREPVKERILIVEDERELCHHLKRELEKEGWRVDVAYDGIEGLEFFKGNHIDVVVADIKMPKMNGLEMLKNCREITDDFVSIIITGHGDYEKAIDALKLGVFDYLKKPFSLEEFITSVKRGIEFLYLHRGLAARERELEIETAIKEHYARDMEKIVKEKIKELKQSYEKLQKIMDEVINAMAFMVEMRDPYTAGHQRRVAELASAIAEEMGFSKERIKWIWVAGIIHDVGKISIPIAILSKPGQISEIEFNMIKTHSQVGYEILKNIDFPAQVAQTILQHHERMDGSGYPNGLKGKEIISEARILGVADVIEAMSSHRPYRPALGIDKALQEISENRGILYDPEVVDACLKVFQKGFKFSAQ